MLLLKKTSSVLNKTSEKIYIKKLLDVIISISSQSKTLVLKLETKLFNANQVVKIR